MKRLSDYLDNFSKNNVSYKIVDEYSEMCSSYLLTDLQWFRDNLLCLITNAIHSVVNASVADSPSKLADIPMMTQFYMFSTSGSHCSSIKIWIDDVLCLFIVNYDNSK